jgi:hypothetical protein
MIEKISDLPDNVIGFSARGTVTSHDYESVIIPAVEGMFTTQGKVRLLYQLGDDFSGFEASAMWDDTKLGLKHFSGWEKVALVTDIEWVRWALKIFGLAMPGHVRVFENSEIAKARQWVSE